MNRSILSGFLLGFVPSALALAAFGVLNNISMPFYLPMVACMAVPGGILGAIFSWLGREISRELGSTKSSFWGVFAGLCSTILLVPFLFILAIVVPSILLGIFAIDF